MTAWEHWPDLDDLGYEFWREALNEDLDWLRIDDLNRVHKWPRVHWPYSPAERHPACCTTRGHAVLATITATVTCWHCRRTQAYRAATKAAAA